MRVGEDVGVVGQEHSSSPTKRSTALSRWPTLAVSPVSTKEIRQSSMSERRSVTSCPPFSSTKSLVSASL